MSSDMRIPFDDLIVGDGGVMTWREGPFTGVAYETGDSGRVMSEVAFVDGLQHGIAREWFESGRLRAESEFAHGSRHGRSRSWHENGQLAADAQYQYSVKTEEKLWSDGGAVVADWCMPEEDEQRGLIDVLARRFGGASGTEE